MSTVAGSSDFSTRPTHFQCDVMQKEVKLLHPLEHRYCLMGRATSVLRCFDYPRAHIDDHSMPPADEPMSTDAPDAAYQPKPLVFKLAWPEDTCISEFDVLKEAARRADNDERITNHIPNYRDCQVHNFKYNTKHIRDILEVKWHTPPTAGRVFRGFTEPLLDPITKKSGREFLVAFLQIIRCESSVFIIFFMTIADV